MVDVAAFIMFVNEPIPACPMAATVSGCFSRAPLRTERVPGQSRSSSSRNIMNSLRALANPRLRAAERSYFFSCLKQRMRVSLRPLRSSMCHRSRHHPQQSAPSGSFVWPARCWWPRRALHGDCSWVTTLIGMFLSVTTHGKMPRFKPLYAKRDHTLQVCLHCLFHGKNGLHIDIHVHQVLSIGRPIGGNRSLLDTPFSDVVPESRGETVGVCVTQDSAPMRSGL